MKHTNPTTTNNRPGRRLARRAAALAIAASAAVGVTAAGSLDAGAWTPAPDGPLGGGWAPSLPVPFPTPSPSPLPSIPRITLPDSAFRPVLPDLPVLPPVSDLPIAPPVDDGGGDDDPAGVRPLDPSRVRPIDPGSLVPDEPLCELVDCGDPSDDVADPEEPSIPPAVESEDCLPTTPASWGAEAGTIIVSGPCEELTPDGTPEDLGYPDSEGQVGEPTGSTTTTEPEVTPVRVESATGSLAFTGSDLALPLAGAGLLGAGGVLAGISVLARRTRSGRS
ncbi:MAG: hypothetical protein ACOYOQ_09860 [Microthrixaceae bacterium]